MRIWQDLGTGLAALAVVLAGGAAPSALAQAGAANTPPAPDYADIADWAAGPAGFGPSAVLPAGASKPVKYPRVDVFYVHPTVFSSETALNQDLADAQANRWVDEGAVAREASAFTSCCRVFAPRYRAASFQALAGDRRDAAFALAYADVESAFGYYLAHFNKGRPFILAGDGQGASLLAALLDRRFEGTVLRDQLVAAYLVGGNVAQGDFGRRWHGLPACDEARQTGCVVQWNVVAAGSNLPALAAPHEQAYTARTGDVAGQRLLCTNPLTFEANRPDASAGAARGAIPGAPGYGAPAGLEARAVAARCEHGLLVVSPDAALKARAAGDGSLGQYGYTLFYQDIRENAALRAAAWRPGQA
ncbi:MAG TPA: DUF3089 domain-containing protein, partial [Novosphingobium sp.]|nr:DUF3089 domain-containing protein [Novosphingobium sp.]